MRLTASTTTVSAAVAALFAPLAVATGLQCENIVVDNQKYDLSSLRGPHSVVTTIAEAHAVYNTTYTLDLCAPLKRAGENIPSNEQCPEGTRVCAVQRASHEGDGADKKPSVREAVPLAGDLVQFGGAPFEYHTAGLNAADRETIKEDGFQLELPGGVFPVDAPSKEQFPKKTVITFLCDMGKTGLEAEWKPEVDYVNVTALLETRDGEETNAEKQFVNEGAALIFDKYSNEGKEVTGTLRLTWKTKYACQSVARGDSTRSWGFFTWFIILAFMFISAYIIFGSWLNYTRYGARGWDLLPHSDAIRDVPYLMQDFTRKVLNTVQNSGSRGGYSAV
ncbi:hypothetical protein TD95_003358 [Thielaviopsis punctulata]|uniref:Autophagy-related protein 27 n=1 Tax=Thielaviopsis punctulata TaxID=72032 RepID=A0A0F4ZKM8_9PEZI|nr:hypothetical protein TD95_003358 [Thielaviopsis punctulata]